MKGYNHCGRLPQWNLFLKKEKEQGEGARTL